MVFTSYEFIGFFLAVLLLYYIIPQKIRWVLLLLASVVFYACSGVKALVFIALSILAIYVCALLVDNNAAKADAFLKAHKEEMSKEERTAFSGHNKNIRKAYVSCGIVITVGLLIFCKSPFNSFILPLGISFYTLSSVGYLIDVYRKTVRAERNPLKLALFVSFFPLVIQGPISRFKDLSATLYSGAKFDSNNVCNGLKRILWGFFKKLVIADRLLIPVSLLIKERETYTGIYALAAMILYTIELYADFTGGIDITIGIGECFGIKIAENFNLPYFSKSLKEYWRRWHMSMAGWFRDYVFYPLSTTKFMIKLSKSLKEKGKVKIAKRLPVYLSSFVVWLLTGLWHGTTWNFIVWGLLNYLVLMISEEFEGCYSAFHGKFAWSNKKGYEVFMILRNFLLICALNLFDCYVDVRDTLKSFASMFDLSNIGALFDGSMLLLGLNTSDWVIILAGIVLMLCVSLSKLKKPVRERIAAYPAAVSCTLWFALFLAVLLFGIYGVGYDSAQFIYNKF